MITRMTIKTDVDYVVSGELLSKLSAAMQHSNRTATELFDGTNEFEDYCDVMGITPLAEDERHEDSYDMGYELGVDKGMETMSEKAWEFLQETGEDMNTLLWNMENSTMSRDDIMKELTGMIRVLEGRQERC